MYCHPERSTGGAGLGGYVGYNMQWEDVILGLGSQLQSRFPEDLVGR